MLKGLTKGKVDNTVITFNYFVGYMHLGHVIDNILNACCFTVLLDVSTEPVTVVWVEFALNTCDLEHLSMVSILQIYSENNRYCMLWVY